MAFSVVTKRRLRGLGLHRVGRHAASKSEVPVPRTRTSAEGTGKPQHPYQGLHKASGPRLSGPYEKRAA